MTDISIPVQTGVGAQVIRNGEIIFDSYQASQTAEAKLKDVQAWGAAMLAAIDELAAQTDPVEMEFQLAAVNQGIERFNDAFVEFVEVKFQKENDDGV